MGRKKRENEGSRAWKVSFERSTGQISTIHTITPGGIPSPAQRREDFDKRYGTVDEHPLVKHFVNLLSDTRYEEGAMDEKNSQVKK